MQNTCLQSHYQGDFRFGFFVHRRPIDWGGSDNSVELRKTKPSPEGEGRVTTARIAGGRATQEQLPKEKQNKENSLFYPPHSSLLGNCSQRCPTTYIHVGLPEGEGAHSLKLTALRGSDSGFTLIELIMVMVIIGILAVSAIPRFADQSVFEARGFHDQTLALLRYAQKAAIAQRRTVCVAFTSTTAVLTIASVADSSNCNTNLIGPDGQAPFTITARSGTAYATVQSGLNFNALGVPSAARTIQVSGAERSITVEAETGYIHE